jgi:hypothetical protein
MPVIAMLKRGGNVVHSLSERTTLRGSLFVLSATLALSSVTGCVERRMVLITDPYPDATGAIVYDEKDQPLPGTPVDKPFTYYGKYHFRIVKDGFETLDVEQRVRAPWYELPGLDFVSENLIPWTIRDVRYYTYVMQRPPIRTPDQTLIEGQQLQAYGKTLGPQIPDPNPPATVSPPPAALGTPVREP